jgi:serine/threonine protein kinase
MSRTREDMAMDDASWYSEQIKKDKQYLPDLRQFILEHFGQGPITNVDGLAVAIVKNLSTGSPEAFTNTRRRLLNFLKYKRPTSPNTLTSLRRALSYPSLGAFIAAFGKWRDGKNGPKSVLTESDDGNWEFPEGLRIRTTDDQQFEIIRRIRGGKQRGNSYEARLVDRPGELRTFFVKSLKLSTTLAHDKMKRRCGQFQNGITRERDTLSRLKGVNNVATFLGNGQIQYLPEPGRTPIDIPFLVQDFVKGREFVAYLHEKFGTMVRGRRTFAGIKEPKEFVRLARSLIQTLGEVHRRGIVHADLRPENLMEVHEAPYVVDFGESFLIWEDEYPSGISGSSLSSESSASSIPIDSDPYLAPERHRNDQAPWEIPADRFSLGGCLYYFATGTAPPQAIADDPKYKDELLQEIERRNPTLLEYNPGMGDAIVQCLHYDLKDRVAHTEDLLRLIDAFEIAADRKDTEPTQKRLEEASTSLVQAIKKIEKSENPLFQRLLAHDLAFLARKTQSMVSVQRAEIAGTRDDIILGLLHYLAELRQDDCYFTATIPSFWSRDNLSADGRFLRMNEFLALQGVIIRRVFLICKSDIELGKPNVNDILMAHHRVLIGLKKQGINVDDPKVEASGFYAGYKTMSEEMRNDIIRDGFNVGVVRRKGSSVTISFQVDRLQLIRRLYVRTAESELGEGRTTGRGAHTSAKIANIRNLLAESKPLSRFSKGDLEASFR